MKQSIRMVVSDLDRTLLRDDKTVSPRTRQVLARLRQQGILLAAATARPPASARRAMAGLALDGAVCHSGSVVLLGGWDDAALVARNGLDAARAGALCRRVLARHPAQAITLEAGDMRYANFDAGAVFRGEAWEETDFTALPDVVVDKIVMPIGAVPVAQLAEFLEDGMYMQVVEGALCAFMHHRATKRQGVQVLCARLGVGMEEVVAFGDDENDRELLAACGHGVAMANALPGVQAAANETCAANQDDGVARWLEEHLL